MSITMKDRRDKPARPTKEQVAAARRAANISQDTAAALVHLSSSVRWSEYERGERNIDPAKFELFQIKTGQHPDYVPRGVAITA
jgi:transcriptional regulator with XRE-family HTH domain